MSSVQYEEMLPDEFRAALAAFPVAYVPFGSLEWHGRHLPYGVEPPAQCEDRIAPAAFGKGTAS